VADGLQCQALFGHLQPGSAGAARQGDPGMKPAAAWAGSKRRKIPLKAAIAMGLYPSEKAVVKLQYNSALW